MTFNVRSPPVWTDESSLKKETSRAFRHPLVSKGPSSREPDDPYPPMIFLFIFLPSKRGN